MPKATRTEVHANPNTVFLVRKDIYIVVSASNGSELRSRFLLKRFRRFQLPRVIIE